MLEQFSSIMLSIGKFVAGLLERKKVTPEVPPLRVPKPMDNRFSENSEFCPYCLTSDYWYRGGGSWSPDRCPYHPTSDDFILWKQMTKAQRDRAANRFNNMWFNKYDCPYFKKDQPR